jgi:putative colanic acid biosynthesis UDP-glucose lipid carrier transferase
LIKNYSIFIKPISVFAHLVILNIVFYLGQFEHYTEYYHILFFNISWLVLSYFTGLYHYHRTITITQVARHLLIQFSIYTFVFFSYYTFIHQELQLRKVVLLLFISFLGITIFRAIYFYALRRYRIGGGNFRKVIFIGSGSGLRPIVDFMMNRADFGFKIMGYFSDDSKHTLKYSITDRALMKDENNGFLPFLGTLENFEQYALENNIDEIYCSLSELKDKEILSIFDFGDQHMKIVKLVPDNKDFITKSLKLEYYGFVPVYSIRNFPLDKPIDKFFKRLFDIIFSFLVLVFVLSWLTPILYLLIKKESKGPLFFKQEREGIKGNSFVCYKYRSMGVNDRSSKDQTVKGDLRITKMGKFIRKTSIDELPQFLNVFIGDMSVVGPRPHMLTQSNKFKKVVDKYMVRHFVKPGITGLAQVRGYRGEIETNDDIINRVKLDIFYVENWSFVMDINIILKTVLNVFIGEDKAY